MTAGDPRVLGRREVSAGGLLALSAPLLAPRGLASQAAGAGTAASGYNKPTAFYSDFTEADLFSPITPLFPAGPGKFVRRLAFGSAQSALGSSTDNTADCLIDNKEQQCYTDAGVQLVPEGVLLQGVRGGANPIGQPWSSGCLCSSSAMTTLYGYAEVVAKLPPGFPGLFPAIWLLGVDPKTRSWMWEIDIAEFARDPTVVHGGAIQWGNRQSYTSSALPKGSCRGAATGFHKYAARWDRNAVRFFIDDAPFATYPTLPPMPLAGTYPAYLIINLAMGGPPGYAGQTDASTPSPADMYVRSAGLWRLSDWPKDQLIPRTPAAGSSVPDWTGP